MTDTPTSPRPPAPDARTDLDDLRFQPLVDAAKRSLPTLAPHWTDHNVSDPGITLIEACAQRVDQLVYRANRLTPRHRVALMRLMGIAPAPASSAVVLLRVSRRKPTHDTVVLPANTPVTSPGRSPVVYHTRTDLTIASDATTGLVEATHVESVTDEILGSSDGTPGQRFAPSQRPRNPAPDEDDTTNPGPDLSVRVGSAARTDEWTRVLTFAGATGDTACYRWDPAAGEVAFGPNVPYAATPKSDGSPRAVAPRQQGRIPAAGAAIHAVYTVGGGSRGNLPEGIALDLAEPLRDTLSVTLETLTRPGTDEETWQDALRRTHLQLVPLRRAVTASDHEQVVAEVRDVARVWVTPEARPVRDRAPASLCPPARPVYVDAAYVDHLNTPPCLVTYAETEHHRIPLDPASPFRPLPPFPIGYDDSPFDNQAPPDAVVGFRSPSVTARLWFRGEHCRWDDETETPISEVFPQLKVPLEGLFTHSLDGVCAYPENGVWRVFFFKNDSFCHTTCTFAAGKFEPAPGSTVAVATIASGFPGLPRAATHSPDAVVLRHSDRMFFFLTARDTHPAPWSSEDNGLNVFVVPRTSTDPGAVLTTDRLEPTPELRGEVSRRVDAMRLLGERLRVRRPDYVSFDIGVTVRPWADTADRVTEVVTRGLRHWYHPCLGGPDGDGTPWGQAIRAGEAACVVERLAEVRGLRAVDLRVNGRTTQIVPVPDGALPLLDKVTVTVTNAEE
ncbi:baseplate J/gp47 family protein [Embleya sp. NPDC059259]|uniref:baseplate J/gp47 family protein n=1 Tax=unclassified Embleya TaxID=2699296 RepID=UPI0036BC57C9